MTDSLSRSEALETALEWVHKMNSEAGAGGGYSNSQIQAPAQVWALMHGIADWLLSTPPDGVKEAWKRILEEHRKATDD